jgi:transcriptional regulator with XRE-family HTH domain
MTLRQMREAAGFPRAKDAAERSGLDYTTICKLEGGKIPNPRIGTFEALAGAYGRTLDEVLAAWRTSNEVEAA